MDLRNTIKSYLSSEYGQVAFEALHTYVSSLSDGENDIFFSYTLPCIVQFALDLPSSINTRIGLLRAETEHFVLLSQGQIACILANAFLCTFAWRRWRDTETAHFPNINFVPLFDRAADPTRIEKIKCIVHYFNVLAARKDSGAPALQQTVLFQRRIGARAPAARPRPRPALWSGGCGAQRAARAWPTAHAALLRSACSFSRRSPSPC